MNQVIRSKVAGGLRTMLLAFVILGFCACMTTSKDREEAELRLQIGSRHLEKGDYPSALRELLLAEKADPKNVKVHNNLGLVYFFRDKFDLASSHLRRALELDPKFTEARNNLGRVLIEQTRYDQAIKELKIVVDDLTYADPAKAWVNMGLAHFHKGDFTRARDSFATAVQINRNHCLGQTFYGRSLLELGDLNTAAQTLDNAVVICRPLKFDEPHYFSGLAYYKLGRTSSAIARLEEVTKLYPQSRFAQKAESMLKLMK